jgi:hypothetical protein
VKRHFAAAFQATLIPPAMLFSAPINFWVAQMTFPPQPCLTTIILKEDHKLAKPNYQFEKRKRDIEKKAKKEEKKLRKLKPADPSPPTAETK